MKTALAVYYFLIKKHLVFINSPLQFICFIEYFKKFKNNFNIIFVGYSNPYNIKTIRAVENFYIKKKIKFKVIYLNETLNVVFFHFILNLRKYFFLKFESVLIGDYRYYLHRKIISISIKKILVDDGFGTLYFNKFFSKKIPNSIFFTAYPLKYNVNKIIENNFDFLKSIYKSNKKKIRGCIFLLPGLSVKKVISNEEYLKWINKIKNKIKNSITLVPHPVEKEFIKKSKILKTKFHIKINYLPIELGLLKFKHFPKKIIHNYSSCSIILNKIFGKKVKILNYENKNLEKIIDYYNKGKKENETIIPIKNFYKKKKLDFI